MHRRLQISLTTTTQLKAEETRDIILDKLTQFDLWTDEDAVYNKNQEAIASKDVDSLAVEQVDIISATYLFKDSKKAETTFEDLKKLTEVKGLISLHYCPEEGEISDWLGCSQDPRADYKEVVF